MEFVLICGAFVSGIILGNFITKTQYVNEIKAAREELQRLESELHGLQQTQPRSSLTMWDD